LSSKAYAKFTKSIKRCEELARTYTILAEARKQNQKIPAPKDIVRASATLSVAALDAYITDVFTEYLVPYLKKYKTDASLINLLSDAGLDTKEALNLLSMDRPYRRIRTLVSKYYSSYTTQRFDVIDKLFLPYRLNKITDNAQKMSGRKSLKSSVQKLISRRHEIVHAGDYNSHGKINNINEKQIETRIKDLEMLVNNIDTIIANRMSNL
jgi:hypothetical protein